MRDGRNEHDFSSLSDELPQFRDLIDDLWLGWQRAKEIAQELPPDFYREFSDQQLVEVIYFETTEAEATPLGELALVWMAAVFTDEELSQPFWDSVWPVIWGLLQSAFHVRLLEEFESRRSRNESTLGRAARAFLIKKDGATKKFASLAKENLRIHPDYPDEVGREVIESSLFEALMIRLAAYFDQPGEKIQRFHALLVAFMRDELNHVSRNARRDVLDRLRRASRINKKRTFSEQSQEEDEDDTDFMDSFPGTQDKKSEEIKVIVESIRPSAKLSETQTNIIEMCLQEKTQREIAAELGMSRQAVSNHLQKIGALFPEIACE